MSPSTRRLVRAVVAWPAGIVAALVLVVVTAPGCPAGAACALEPVPAWRIVVLLTIALGPGLYATMSWWRGRRSAD
jgi:hypothetical protein